jgi:hypothetical protein
MNRIDPSRTDDDRWLDALLAADACAADVDIPDEGFSSRVIAALPARNARRLAWLPAVLGILAALALVIWLGPDGLTATLAPFLTDVAHAGPLGWLKTIAPLMAIALALGTAAQAGGETC